MLKSVVTTMNVQFKCESTVCLQVNCAGSETFCKLVEHLNVTRGSTAQQVNWLRIGEGELSKNPNVIVKPDDEGG